MSEGDDLEGPCGHSEALGFDSRAARGLRSCVRRVFAESSSCCVETRPGEGGGGGDEGGSRRPVRRPLTESDGRWRRGLGEQGKK